MGIELPAELRDVAARAGARWPEADEDAMRRSAAAWRDTAKSIGTLARDADSTAQGALAAMEGEASQAARREWDGFIADGGRLPRSAKECMAAADRLDHAAEQIGAAKVQMVRELVALAKNTDAAERAAATGHPQALAALDTAVRGASAGLARVHETLTTAVDIDSGVTMESASSGRPSGLVRSVGDVAEAGAQAVAGGMHPGFGPLASTLDDVGAAAGRLGEQGAGGVGDTIVGGAIAPVGETPSAPGGLPWQGDVEHTGPVSPEVMAGPWSRGTADAGTGPLPVIGDARPGGWSAGDVDPASTTAPHTVHQAWASPSSGAAGPPPPPPGPAYQVAPPPSAGGHFVAPPPQGTPHGGGAPAQAGPRPPVAGPPVAGQRPPGPVGPPAQRAQPPGAQPPAQPAQHGQPAHHAPPVQRTQRGPLRPAAGPTPPPAPAQPEPPQRPLRQGDRNATVVAFVLHQFPIGHMPVAASRASRQLPPPPPEADHRLRFRPQDHPQADLVGDAEALARVRSGEARESAARALAEPGERREVPAELVAGHDPLGELSELEWERKYKARSGGEGRADEYVWPPGDVHPEGGVEAGEPIVLAPGSSVDCFGTAEGRVLAAVATPFSQRCLPPEYRERDYRRYRVLRPLPVWLAVNAPWFAQPGGGIRYRTTYPVVELVAMGYLTEAVDGSGPAAAQTSKAQTSKAQTSKAQIWAAQTAEAQTLRIEREQAGPVPDADTTKATQEAER